MTDPTKLALMSIVRSALIAAGGYAVAKGWIGQGNLEQIVGAIIVLLTATWGAVDKLKKPEGQ